MEVRDWLGDPRGGTGRVGQPSRRFGTGRGTLEEVRNELGYPKRGPGQVGGPSERSRMGRGTLVEVWDGSGVYR